MVTKILCCLMTVIGLSGATPAMYGSKALVVSQSNGHGMDSSNNMAMVDPMAAIPQRSGHRKGSIYTFAFCGQQRPFHFTDESGRLTGFSVDLMQEICDGADKICSMTYIYNTSECWDEKSMRSRGLNDRWYDAVVDMMDTKGRGLVHSFSGRAYAMEPASFLYAARTSTISAYDRTKHAVGHVRGNWIDDSCLKTMSLMSVRHFTSDSYDVLMTALDKGEVDIAFMEERVANGYRKVSNKMKCATSGRSIMSRKDMMYELYWVADGLKKIRNNGKFERLCYIASKAYGGDPGCMKTKM